MGLNWDIINFQLKDDHIYSTIKPENAGNEAEIFENINIKYKDLILKIPYNIDWVPLRKIIDDYILAFKNEIKRKKTISDLNIKKIKHGEIIVDKDHCISSSFSCIYNDSQSKTFEFHKPSKFEIKQNVDEHKNLPSPLVRGGKYSKYRDFNIRGHALQSHSAIYQGLRLIFFGLGNNFENYLHINGFVVDYMANANNFSYGQKIYGHDEHFFGRMDNKDLWTYLGKCNVREKFSDTQLIHYFSC